MKKIIIMTVLVVIGLSSGIRAGTHYISDEDLAEQKVLIRQFEKDPSNVNARFELAMNLAYTGWVELGWKVLKKVPQYHKDYAPVVINKYSRLIKQDPENWKHHFKIAFGYYFKKQEDKAIDSFYNVLEIDDGHVWAMGFIAYLESRRKNVDEAVEILELANDLEPDSAALRLLLAEGYKKQGRTMKFLGQITSVLAVKSAEAKYRPTISGI